MDISATVLERAAEHAADKGVAERTHFEQHDLSQSFPGSPFDLVYALYLKSPVEFPRDQVLRRAADAVAPGGQLLIVSHGSVVPWSWNQKATFPTSQEALDSLDVNHADWHIALVGNHVISLRR